MKSKELREKAGEIAKKLDALTIQCRQEERSPTEEEQREFVALRAEAQKYLTEAEGLELLHDYEGNKLNRLKREGNSFSTVVNVREKADPELALRSWLGRETGWSTPEWDEHARILGHDRKVLSTRAWSTTGSGTGAEFIPTTLADQVYRKLLAYGGLLPYLASKGGTFTHATGEPYVWPEFDATGLTGALVAENAADSAVDLASSSKTFTSYCYSSGIQKVSFQDIRDSKYPIIPMLSDGLSEAIGRKLAAVLISGTGSSQPEGILTNANVGVTAASATTFTIAELRALRFAVNEPHATNGVYVVSRSAMQTLLGLCDTLGRPLWQPSLVTGQPGTFEGYPVYVDLNLPTVAASHKPVIFGDIARGYKVRFVGDLVIRASDDRYFEYNQTAVVANQFADARPVDLDCYAVLQMAAS